MIRRTLCHAANRRERDSKGLFAAHELNCTELTCNESTQLHDVFIGHAR